MILHIYIFRDGVPVHSVLKSKRAGINSIKKMFFLNEIVESF